MDPKRLPGPDGVAPPLDFSWQEKLRPAYFYDKKDEEGLDDFIWNP